MIGCLGAVADFTAWSGWQDGLFFGALSILIAFGVWRKAFVPFVALMPHDLIVQNRLSNTSIPYADIKGVSGGYYGLIIRLRQGRVVTAWAVQKSNAARWLNKRTRVDDVADAIMARVPRAIEANPPSGYQ